MGDGGKIDLKIRLSSALLDTDSFGVMPKRTSSPNLTKLLPLNMTGGDLVSKSGFLQMCTFDRLFENLSSVAQWRVAP